MSLAILRWYLPDANFRRAATHLLQKHFPDKSEQVWRSTRDWQSRLAPSRPRYGFSLNLLMRYYEWNLSPYRALLKHGVNQVEAGEFVETVGADYYQPVAAAMFKLSRLRSAKRETRIEWIFGILTRYFFTPPFAHRGLPAFHHPIPSIPVHVQYPSRLQRYFAKETRQGAKGKGHDRRPNSKGARAGSDGPAGTARKAESAKN